MSSFRYRAAVAMTLLLVGCGTGKVSVSKSTSKAPANATSEDVLASAIYQLRPENFSISASVDKPVSLLNSWRFKQAETDSSVGQPAPADAPAGWIVADDEARLAQAKFDTDDAIHIRDAFFYRAIAGYVSDRGRSEVQRVNSIIDFVCRNIALWKDDEIDLPIGPFLVMQVGRGAAEDRALVCNEILRQFRIDSLILRAKSDAKESSDKWLFGVVIDRKIRLYDLRLGLPLAGGAEDSPAALDELIARPELLGQMSAKEPYRITADDLREPLVSVISDPIYWCQRMRRLELVLPANDACVIYEPLTDTEGHSGLISRIAAAGGWPVERVNLWKYHQKQSAKSRQMTAEASQELQKLTLPLIVPIPFKIGDDGKPVQGTPERKFQRYRMDHLLGKFADATQRYLSIRHLEVEKYPTDLERLNRMAAEDAFYWSALCKVELEDYPSAVDLLKDYLKKYDRKGKWFFSARSLLAQCQAQIGNIPDAISTLERSSSEDPYRITNAILSKRWSTAPAK